MRIFKSQAGFTLIEIMIVVIILAILAAAVIPRLTGRTQQAKESRAKADIETLSLALDLYAIDNGFFPSSTQGLNDLRAKPTSPPVPTSWRGPYIKRSTPKDPWGTPYKYASPGMHNIEDYDIYTFGPDGVQGGGDDIANWETETPSP